MLRPQAFRFLHATFPRGHARFFVATPPIRGWFERQFIGLRQRTDSLVTRLATSFTSLGGEINRVTGYDEIESLKRQVVSQESRVSASRKAARDAKAAYAEAIQKRSDSQREVKSLLKRKSMRTDTDVSRFTAQVLQDHALEQEEARAKAAVAQTEDDTEHEFDALMHIIRARYDKEQDWSDNIRKVSMYGQLAVLVVNVLVFVFAIALVEPWKRRRLAQTFERKVEELEAANLDVVTRGMETLRSGIEEQEKALATLAAALSTPPVTILREPVAEDSGLGVKREDVKLFAASVSIGIFAWVVRGWVGH